MFRNGFVFRLIAVLVLIGLVAAGGYFVYQAGIAQGVSQAPEVAESIERAAEGGQGAPVMPMYGYGYPYRGFGYPHHFGFFPLGGICFSIFFIFLFLGLLRFIFFRPWHRGWGYHGYHGPWGKWEGGVPPMFDEWHKRAHGETGTQPKSEESRA
jgi:hypothetical protein